MSSNTPWTRDEIILVLDLYFRVSPTNSSDKSPEIIELSNILNALPVHLNYEQKERIRNPKGVHMKLYKFLHFDPSYLGKRLFSVSKLDKEIWEEFANQKEKLAELANLIKTLSYKSDAVRIKLTEITITDEYEETSENKVLKRIHKMIERNPLLSKRKKRQVLSEDRVLRCEVCGLDFNFFYGARGKSLAECHHKTPVSNMLIETDTKLSELSIVCANCHEDLHKGKPSILFEELKQTLHAEKILNYLYFTKVYRS
jgi:5-methylcytosine-specific restriction protein A